VPIADDACVSLDHYGRQRLDILADVLSFTETQLRINAELMAQVATLHAENAEMRDDMLALSNRIESLTRAVAS
jgi:hypothetical protein